MAFEPAPMNKKSGGKRPVSSVRIFSSASPGRNYVVARITQDVIARAGLNVGDRVDILVGTDADKGKICIWKNDSGVNSINRASKRSAQISITRAFSKNTPGISTTPAEFETSEGALIITVPEPFREYLIDLSAEAKNAA